MKLSIILVAAALLLPVGCASQGLKPTVHSWTLTGSIPGETIPAGTSWFFFKDTLAAGATTCDPPTSTNYHQVNAAGQASPTITDSTAAGTTICAFLQFQDAATPAATSPYSNIVGPLAVPANPTAPAANSTTASNEVPETTTVSGVTANAKVADVCAGGAPPHNAPDCIPVERAYIFAAPMGAKPVGDPSMFVYAHQKQKPVAVASVR